MSGRYTRKGLIALLVAFGLVATACGSSNEGGTTSTTSSADTTTSQSTAPPEDTTSSAPESPTESSTTSEAETSQQAPTEKGSITIGFSAAAPQVEKIPTIQAFDDLKADGYKTEVKFLSDPSQVVQAVAQGAIDFGSTTQSSIFAAISKGVPIQIFQEANGPAYAMVAPVSVTSPEGLNGLRVGIHAKVSATALYTDIMLENYPDVKPKILIVPGSANRIQALAAGQLDASVVQLSDLPDLEKQAPGKFHVIYNFSQKNPEILDSLIFAKTDTVKNKPDLVKTVIAAVHKEHQAAYTDTDALIKAIAKYVPKTDEALATENAKTYTDAKVWPSGGDRFTEASVQKTMEEVKKAGMLETVPSISDCCNFTLLQSVSSGS